MKFKMIAYYRVSTARQGHSGLGLEAQKADVREHLERSGCELVGEYVEVETGKKHSLDNRPELKKAIAQAKRAKAILVVAKLDRLLRSTVVRSMLKTSGVRFVACDNPHANELTVDILAAVAEDEVRRISARTKAALAAYKARGGRLGASLNQCRNLTRSARRKGAKVAGASHRRNADEAYHDVVGIISDLHRAGWSLREISEELTHAGFTTRRGKAWNAVQVSRVLDRALDRES
jgi:DNA invertase Pin-like site-specific DNA recombinase